MAELQPGESQVGFVGLGAMGTPIARRLARTFPLRVHDLDPEAVAPWTSGPCEAAVAEDVAAAGRGAGAVVLMLPDSAAVEAVVPALLAVLEPGALIVDMSSSDPVSTRTLHQRAAAAGVGLVDAPVSGGVAGAEAGTLTAMIGGHEADFHAAEPLLEPLTSGRFHVGEPGAGHAVKALNNLVSAAGIAITSEALEIGSRFGIDPERMIEIFNSSSGRNYATEYKFPEFILRRQFESGFRLGLQCKDVDTALRLAEFEDCPAPVATACADVWSGAETKLGAAADHTEIARLYRISPAQR
jgi:3-hydroxyisobutyrate dehydrogenase